MFKEDKFLWTNHARDKMRYYRLTESRLKRIIRHPARTEEAVLEGAVACMQLSEGKKYSEIWVMYALAQARGSKNDEARISKKLENLGSFGLDTGKKIRIITAWRYPGKSPERDPIPADVLAEIRNLL